MADEQAAVVRRSQDVKLTVEQDKAIKTHCDALMLKVWHSTELIKGNHVNCFCSLVRRFRDGRQGHNGLRSIHAGAEGCERSSRP